MSAATSTIVAASIAGGIGAAGSIAGGMMAKHGADKAADATLQASREANTLQKNIYDQNRTDLAPWTGAGAASVGRLSYLLGLDPKMGNTQASFNANFSPMGNAPAPVQAPAKISNLAQRGQARPVQPVLRGGRFGEDGLPGPGSPATQGLTPTQGFTATPQTPPIIGAAGGTNDGQFGSLMKDFSTADFQQDPGYDFRLSEGAKALERSASAKGGLFSGGMLKDLTKYNQDFASNEYGNAFNRWNINQSNKYNRLANLAGLGQTSTAQLANSGSNYANSASSNLMNGAINAGNMRASGYGDLASGISSATGTIGNLVKLYGQGRT